MEELQKNPHCIDNLTIDNNGKPRKINKPSLDNIRKYFLSKDAPHNNVQV
jgi:hypothetical protein